MEMSYPLNRDEYIHAEVVQLWHYGRTTGVFSADDDLAVTASDGMTVILSSGAAWIKYSRFGGIVYGNTEELPLTVDLGDSTLNRIDRVCIRYSFSENTIRAIVKKGQVASQPVAPPLQRDLEAYELAVADIRVNAGTSVITQGMISDQRLNESLCGVVRDGVSGIPTAVLHAQWKDWFDNIKSGVEFDAFDLSQWMQIFKMNSQVDYGDWFSTFQFDSIEQFEGLANQIRDILGGDAAGALLNIINSHVDTSVNSDVGVHEIRQKDGFIQTFRDGQWSGVTAGYATPNVSDLQVSAGIDNIFIGWKDPADVTYQGIDLARWKKTIIVYRTDRMPENEHDGAILDEITVRNQYAVTPLEHSGLILGQRYYYGIFPVSDANIVNRNTENRISAETSVSPPGDVIEFYAEPGQEQITLTWGDPQNQTEPNIITWAGTKIVRNEERYPINENDGVVVVNNTVRNQYRTDGFVDDELIGGHTYYYQAFPYSTQGVINRNASNRLSATPEEKPVFTLEYTGTHTDEVIEDGVSRYRLLTLTTSGQLTVSGAPVYADIWMCGAGANGTSVTTVGQARPGGAGGRIASKNNTLLVDGAVVVGANNGALSSYLNAGLNTLAASGKNGGTGGGAAYSDTTPGTGAGIPTTPFGMTSIFQPHCAGGGGGSRKTSSSTGNHGGSGGTNGGNGGNATDTTSVVASVSGGLGGLYGGGRGASSSAKAEDATFYGGGGGGGGSDVTTSTIRSAGLGYQGVVYIRILI